MRAAHQVHEEGGGPQMRWDGLLLLLVIIILLLVILFGTGVLD